MLARIYKPAKTAMQSGRGKARDWTLEFEPVGAKERDPLMGWTGSSDTSQQVRLFFETREDAAAYCKRHGLEYEIDEPHEQVIRPKSYASNFRWDRPS